jgi:hypothetical protein
MEVQIEGAAMLNVQLILLLSLLVWSCGNDSASQMRKATQSGEQNSQYSRTEVITLQVDLDREKEMQLSVDKGHQPWRLEADGVACSEIGQLHQDRKQQPDLDVRDCLDKRKLEQQGETRAVVTFTTADQEYRVFVERLVKPNGIWTPTKVEILRR